MFQKFLNAGLCVIPLKNGIPTVKWSQYMDKLPTDISAWCGDEYGLVCGKVSGIVAVDIDTNDVAEIEALLNPSPVRKIGSKGYTAFYRYGGEDSKCWKKDGKVICELLSDKRLTTVPPSKHRNTKKPYKWGGQELIGADLPRLDAGFVEAMDKKFKVDKPEFKVISPSIREDVELHQAEDMLRCISPDCSRDEWIQVGMALRDEFGDAARHLWHSWSAGGAKYKAKDADACWRSFNNGGVTIGTLVYFAKQGGWFPEKPVAVKAAAKPKKEKPVIGGLVGEIADWITGTAIIPQPELSLAAAIAFVGMIKGHRVKSNIRGTRTNCLVLSLAPTGGGKEHPQYAIDRLSVACGLEKQLMGRPTSGTALLTGISKASSVALLQVDEMGRYLSNISSARADSFQREIVDYMVELYSSANRTFRGRQYADEKKNPQIILEQPHFCCLGSTIPERIKKACSSAEIVDGFLNRWLVFSTNARPQKNLRSGELQPQPELVEKIQAWMDKFPIVSDNYGKITPQEIELTPEAWDVFVAYEKKVDSAIANKPYPLNELYVRAAEQVIKVAMIISDDCWIGTPEIEAAVYVVENSLQNIISFASGIADNQHEENVLYVLDVIRRVGDGGIGKNEITHRTRKLSNKDRNDILSQLVESEEISVEKDGKKVIFRIV